MKGKQSHESNAEYYSSRARAAHFRLLCSFGGHVKCWATTLAILAVLPASLALAEDFKAIDGKVYKDATVSCVEADGIVLKTKTGISKVYFIELPKDVQDRFHYSPAKIVAAQRDPEPSKGEAKQDESLQANEGGWPAALALPAAFLKFLAAGVLTITGLVAFILNRF